MKPKESAGYHQIPSRRWGLGTRLGTSSLVPRPALGPAQLSLACSTESDGKLGGAWERAKAITGLEQSSLKQHTHPPSTLLRRQQREFWDNSQ